MNLSTTVHINVCSGKILLTLFFHVFFFSMPSMLPPCGAGYS
jgi:hypothetical protein